jgi:hypothetical protein
MPAAAGEDAPKVCLWHIEVRGRGPAVIGARLGVRMSAERATGSSLRVKVDRAPSVEMGPSARSLLVGSSRAIPMRLPETA